MSVQISIDAGFISIAEYARRTGQTYAAVAQQARSGKLPIRERENEKEKIFINNALIIKQAIEQEF